MTMCLIFARAVARSAGTDVPSPPDGLAGLGELAGGLFPGGVLIICEVGSMKVPGVDEAQAVSNIPISTRFNMLILFIMRQLFELADD